MTNIANKILIKICAWCKYDKPKYVKYDEFGVPTTFFWEVRERFESLTVSHGICTNCRTELYEG